ncbi:MAG: helicase-related protein, partial [Actinomycetota bacterium]|nr:helicase-related protein [Actinomycetota bacterium]
MSDENGDTGTAVDERSQLIEYLRKQSIGPADGSDEVLYEPPHRRYLMGVLYPRNATFGDSVTAAEDETDPGVEPDESGDDPIRLSSEWYPSSMGMSMYVDGSPSLNCAISAGMYVESKADRSAGAPGSKAWTRSDIASIGSPEIIHLSAGSPPSTPILGGRATIRSRWRTSGRGHVVTISLVNELTRYDDEKVDAQDCLYQVGFEIGVPDGALLQYPSIDLSTFDEEEDELRLLYRDDRTFAVGHGCAVSWQLGDTDSVSLIRTEFLPAIEVPPITSVTGGPTGILQLSMLADPNLGTDRLSRDLLAFVDHYEEWRVEVEELLREAPEHMHETGRSLLAKVDVAIERMRKGVEVLATDPQVLQAFRLANLAMLMQMRHGASDLGGAERQPGTVPGDALPLLAAVPDDYRAEEYSWYPFQLGFILLVLESLVNESSEYRDVVDLLWFPTGGGKTEAYFAVSALEIFLRRMRHGARGGGLTILTRYTMRLLTTQQFQRAASLICAAELIRRDDPVTLGKEPITIGLWVGGAASPNHHSEARDLIEAVVDRPQDGSPFPIQRCPWCGSALVPDGAGEEQLGFRLTDRLAFTCTDTACPFSAGLPIAIVDEDVYRNPPTYMLATVDKFAQLAWKAESSVFFGSDHQMGPSLLIQDEFHLLTGPLGTTAGLYEHAIEAAFSMRGSRPKVVASTATIRRSDAQSKAIFGRPVFLFPPSGIDSDDAYFRRTDRSKPGRMYVGVLAPSHTIATAEVHVASALLQGPTELSMTGRPLDGFSTLVIYHNTKRELGRTMTLARDDIPTRIALIANDEARTRDVGSDSVVELTGNIGGDEVPRVLARLEQSFGSGDHVSVLATTNMMSVGVDVPRLALMMVAGQPKTASEYIQATSRVGRSQVPGLVVTLLSSTKPRDRSHYEGFTPFHSSVYQHVEPTSVTPFSLASRRRALAACLVILARHGLGYSDNNVAGDFDALGDDGDRVREVMMRAVE